MCEKIDVLDKNRIFKYLFFNVIGILMFFVPITFNQKSTIPLDHMASIITLNFPKIVKIYVLAVMAYGAIKPIFIDKNWNKSITNFLFSFAKIAGALIGFMVFFNYGPKALFEKDMLPFLFDKLAIPLSVVIPLGGAFIIFLVGYGMLEFMGVIMEKFMRPIFKTPGKSSIDAVASFVGSYSIGLLITNKVYKEGKYTFKEAAIVATGFSTVSATFMIVVAKTLGIIDRWNFYFWSCMVITFIVTAITVRLNPLKKMPETYYEGIKAQEDEISGKNIFHKAIKAGISSAEKNDENIFKAFIRNYKEGLVITAGIVPSIMSIGLLGLVVAKYTNIFNYVGYIFYPFTSILGFEQPLLVAKSLSTSIAEMFLPAILVTKADLMTRYVVAVVSVSEILFFSASIPCILSTDIKIKVTDLLIIWFQRVVLSLILAVAFAKIFLG